eukprot:TRINITY_DN5196_c0_g1_i4.p1 TRINITY_DN5196_c0_g1~~TRINITY_DN5196_c0_g1_i4.p1  ORF type:complete len:295 (+),score=62.29 TRINITY_DN5196_c0_g1_i4:49-933(+)
MSNRDFRRTYYSQLGFSKVQLEPGVESLLQKEIIDVPTLKEYCLHNTFPSHYRALIWKILLGVLPPYSKTWDHISEQHSQIYEDLSRASAVLYFDESLTQANKKTQTLVRSYSLYRQLYHIDSAQLDEDEDNKLEEADLNPIAELFLEVSGNVVDAFWCMKHFLDDFERTYIRTSSVMYRQLNTLSRLLSEKDNQLFKHMTSMGVAMETIGSKWLQCYFVGCGLKTPVLLAIWDRIACVSPQFVIFVALYILIDLRSKLLETSNPASFEKVLSQISVLNFETILKRAAILLGGK